MAKFKVGDKVIIVDLSPDDAYYHRKEDFIGITGEIICVDYHYRIYSSCHILADKAYQKKHGNHPIAFHKVKLELNE